VRSFRSDAVIIFVVVVVDGRAERKLRWSPWSKGATRQRTTHRLRQDRPGIDNNNENIVSLFYLENDLLRAGRRREQNSFVLLLLPIYTHVE